MMTPPVVANFFLSFSTFSFCLRKSFCKIESAKEIGRSASKVASITAFLKLAVQQSKKTCAIVGVGEGKLRKEEVSHLKLETNTVTSSLEKLEREIKEFEKDLAESKEIRRLASLIVSGKLSK